MEYNLRCDCVVCGTLEEDMKHALRGISIEDAPLPQSQLLPDTDTGKYLQHTERYCNALQHSVTHCNTV